MSNIALALGLSMHLGLEGDYNQIHPHVRWEDDGKIAGAYYNSMDRMSLYAGSVSYTHLTLPTNREV